MSTPGDLGPYSTKLSLNMLIEAYASLQKSVISQINSLASSISTADPGEFLLAQFGMSQVNQIGQTISNMIYQVNSVCMNAVRNQKVQ
jgi:hypothetical protein